MSDDNLTPLDQALNNLSNMMVMNYGATLLLAPTVEEKHDAFVSLVTTGLRILAAAITSQKNTDEVLDLVLEQTPGMLRDFVTEHVAARRQIESVIARNGASLQ